MFINLSQWSSPTAFACEAAPLLLPDDDSSKNALTVTILCLAIGLSLSFGDKIDGLKQRTFEG